MAVINGTDKNQTITGTPDADTVDGKGGNDVIRALGGADILIGGTGNDDLYGGIGNDVYYVDSSTDRAIELANQGTDEIRLQSTYYVLPSNVENITLLNNRASYAGGNGLANVMRGAGGNDVMDGNGGFDTILGAGGDDYIEGHGLLRGGSGNDWVSGSEESDDRLFGDSGSDRLEARGGSDWVYGGYGNDQIIGDGYGVTYYGADRLYGEAGDDWILGGGGNDLGYGGAGNDLIEGEAGDDRLFGEAGNDRLSDKSGDNKLYGGDGNDTLIGTDGNNIMVGGKGADHYFVDNILDAVRENGREGTDDVTTTLNFYSLGANVENLRFVGGGHFFGTGTALNNIIAGGDGNDVLRGGAGNDRLVGAIGQDTAVFAGKSADYAISTVDGITTVTDLNTADGSDGKDTLNGIEFLQFADKAIALSTGPLALMSLSGLQLLGAGYGDNASNAISAGDMNGDGFEDLLIGSPGFDPDGTDYADDVEASAGAAYIVYGDPFNWPPSANLRDLNVSTEIGEIDGFRLEGTFRGGPVAGQIGPGDQVGRLVAAAGDINGDGFADIILSAPSPSGTDYLGEAYVVFGKASGWLPSQDLVDLDGTNGFRIPGTEPVGQMGIDVASAGDINGDGFDDLIVSSASPFQSYVIFGQAGGWTSTFDLAALDGTNGFVIEGSRAVSDAGDINGDGLDDVIVSEISGPNSYIVYGQLAPWDASYVLAELDGTTSVAGSLAVIGDINGDGFDDFANDPTTGPYDVDEGATYVVFGGESVVDTTVDVENLNGTNGFRVNSSYPNDSGRGVPAAAGDVNGDGYQDFMINAGSVYVVYGKAAGWNPSIDLSEINGTNGFRIDSEGVVGRSAGDINGDGFSDLILGRSIGSATDPGASYVFFGGNFNNAVEHLGGGNNDLLTGSVAAESFVGGMGNDTLVSGGGADSFRGGSGDDRIVLSATNFLDIDGGLGKDTIALAGAGLALDLTAAVPGHIHGIERIDLTGTGNNAVQLSITDVLAISQESNSLLVAGNTGDGAAIGAGWTEASTGGSNGDGTSTIGGQTYQHYNAGQASLLVDTDIGVLLA